MNNYKLKLTALTPIHVGTGEVYEPTNFVIDDGYLYEFDEILLVQSLNHLEMASFEAKLDNYIQIIDFFKKDEIKNRAKKIFSTKVQVSSKVQSRYNTTTNKDGTKNKNLFEIHKTFKNSNIQKAIIPGSSLKGMFDTVFNIYPQKGDDNTERQKLIISDAMLIDGKTKIGYCYRKHKNPSKKAKNEIPQIIEAIEPKSTFLFDIKTKLTFEQIIEKFENYFDQESRKNRFFKVNQNSFTARVGKFSGKAFMVYDGKNVKNNDGKPVATHTLYENNSEFGWIKIEKISDDEFEKSKIIIEKQNLKYFEELKNRQRDIKEQITKQKEQQKQKAQEKLAKQKAEEEAKKRAKEEYEAKLKSMSPFEKKVEELRKDYPDPNASISVIVFQALQEDKINEFKQEAVVFIKEKMIKEKTWDKPKKKSAYKRTLAIKELLEE